jgi:hypothetical protein
MIQSKVTVFALSVSAFSLALTGCGPEKPKYEPVPAVSGISATLPPVPTVPDKPIKDGDAYTVWGASYSMRNRVHEKDVVDQKISIVGYITKTNLADAPECAVHKTGKGDPENCRPPIPTFWIADSKDAPDHEMMKVMGWASNFANIYSAIEEFDKAKPDEKPEVNDNTWGVAIPNPLPVKGAKVKITGTYSTSFTQASSGIVADPIMGIMTYKEMEYLEKTEELAILPGMKERKPRK